MREADVWADGEASSGGYSGVGEVKRRGGADGSRNEELGIWKTDEEENSGNDSTWRKNKDELIHSKWGKGVDQNIFSIPLHFIYEALWKGTTRLTEVNKTCLLSVTSLVA